MTSEDLLYSSIEQGLSIGSEHDYSKFAGVVQGALMIGAYITKYSAQLMHS